MSPPAERNRPPLTVERLRDGGFVVSQRAQMSSGMIAENLFASGDFDDVAAYLRDHFIPSPPKVTP